MSSTTRRWTWLGCTLALLGLPAAAAEDPALLKDMTAVIALNGKPCGQAVAVVVVPGAGKEHLVTCQDGHRYRVRLTEEGRVLVEPP